MWYISCCATALNIEMDEIGQSNIEKLQKRYPNGFSEENSRNRKE